MKPRFPRCRRTVRHLATLLLGALLLLPTGSAEAIVLLDDEERDLFFEFTGYIQPWFRIAQDPCIASRLGEECRDIEVSDGFGLQRGHLIFAGQSNRFGSFHIEMRTVPNAELLEARIDMPILRAPGTTDRRAQPLLEWSFGRFKVPFSRQELTSESRLQLIDRAAFIRFTPGRQLGTTLRLSTDFGASALPPGFLNVWAGIFNGESAKARAPILNVDSRFLYGGRIEVHPFGAPTQRMESDLRPVEERSRVMLGLGGNYTYETRSPQNDDYREAQMGADLLLLWQGASLYAEYYRRDRDFYQDTDPDQYAIGWNVQAGLMIPAQWWRERAELVGRVEEFHPARAVNPARRDELIPQQPGSGPLRPEGMQAYRHWVVGANWFFAGHDLKLQANYTFRHALNDWRLSDVEAGDDRVSRQVDDNTFYLQMTYRF